MQITWHIPGTYKALKHCYPLLPFLLLIQLLLLLWLLLGPTPLIDTDRMPTIWHYHRQRINMVVSQGISVSCKSISTQTTWKCI